jgi:hypothetical protein
MEQALSAIHQGNAERHPLTLILARRQGQLGLFLRCPPALVSVAQSQLFAAFPEADVQPVPEGELRAPDGWSRWICSLRLSHPLFPIRRYGQFDDPLNRTAADPLTTLLTTLPTDDTERAWIEVTVRPAEPLLQRRARSTLALLATTSLGDRRFASLVVRWRVRGRWWKRLAAGLIARWGTRPRATSSPLPTVSATRAHEREGDLQAAGDKLSRLLFDATLCLHVAAPAEAAARATRRLAVMSGAFGVFSQPRLARFVASRVREVRRGSRRMRLSSSLLSAEEVATLWHPPTASVQGANLATLPCRQPELPPNLPCPPASGLAILGDALFRQEPRRFGLLPEDRFRHLYLAGKTGMGKSTLLWQLIASDMQAGRGLAVLDPHGDLIDALLPAVPRTRTDQVVLFDAGDAAHPIAFNPLQCRDPAQRPLVASGVLSAFKKIFGDSWGPRLEHILRNSLLTLLELPDASLLTLLSLLGDGRYRQQVLGRVSDPVVRTFWEREFASWPAKYQAEALAPVLNKLGHFVSSPLLRNIVGQTKSRLDLRQVMDGGKMLLVNLAKGRIGEDASALLGAFLVTGLQQAAMARADQPPEQRRDFFLYCDEFQNYTTESFAVVLAEARKYRLGIILAHQFLAQTEESLRSAVFGNVGTMGVFQIGAEDSELFCQQLGGGLLPDDLLNIPRYHAYGRLLIDGHPSRPFLFRTLRPQPSRPDPARADVIRRYSRQRYARPAPVVEAAVAASLSG